MKEALGRQDSDWRLKNVCPACMYKLKGEAQLIFDMLWAKDGNDSLKRRIRRGPKNEEGEAGPSIERIDTRTVGGDIYLSREEVNKWDKELLEMGPPPAEGVSSSTFLFDPSLTDLIGARVQRLC